MSKRQYSDNEKADALAALAANAGNVEKTARQLDIPMRTLWGWSVNISGINDDVLQMQSGKKLSLAERLEDIAYKIIDGMPGMIGKAKLSEAGITLGIVVEKIQLLKGEPTSISESFAGLSPEDKKRRLEALRGRVA